MPGQKTLYLLIGLKGAGKTHIGDLVAAHTDIAFLRVEPIWLNLQPGEDGWQKVEAAVHKLFATHARVMMESLGAGEGFRRMYAALADRYAIVMIHVAADPDTCLFRVRNRSRVDQIAVSDAQVIEYNTIAAGVEYAWDLEIDNNTPLSDAEILSVFQPLLNFHPPPKETIL